MQGTRERILQLVIERRDVRVEELAAELGITQAAVRRHLDHLRADGLVDARAVKQATGRPYHAYHPTERAIHAASAATEDLLERTLAGLGGKAEIVSALSTSVAEALASRYRQRVSDVDDPELRVVELTQSLRPEGILETWRAEEDGIHLLNSTCPYRKAAEISPLPCEADRKTIELLLGLDVEQRHRVVDGAPMCEYVVRAGREPSTVTHQGAS